MNPESLMTERITSLKFQIELIAAVLIRMWGALYLLDAIFYAHHWLAYHRNDIAKGYATMSLSTKIYELDVLFHVAFGLLMMSSALPLARLICRGLDPQLMKQLEADKP
jgi:hypothetical protein